MAPPHPVLAVTVKRRRVIADRSNRDERSRLDWKNIVSLYRIQAVDLRIDGQCLMRAPWTHALVAWTRYTTP
jgi:hypothetical protein